MSTEKFVNAVNLLNINGLRKNEIADILEIHKSNTKEVDNASFTKLLNGTLKSFRKTSIEDLTEKLFSSPKTSKFLNEKILDVSKFDLIFFFYYWSHRNELKIAVLGICKTDNSKSKFIYLKKDKQGLLEPDRVMTVRSFSYADSEVIDIVISTTASTYISAHIGSKEMEEFTISFCSFCGAMGANQRQYAGIGILHKVDGANFEEEFKSLSTKGFSPNIVNALYKRRFDISLTENEVYDNFEMINIPNKEPLKLVKGIWKGFFLRSLIEGEIKNDNKSGGIVKVIMAVEESGLSSIYFREDDEDNNTDLIIYTGIFKFPIENSGTITIGEFQNIGNINRLIMHLKPDTRRLKGVFTGWRTIDSNYFTTPIFFEKIHSGNFKQDESKEKVLADIIIKEKPARYHRSKRSLFEDEISQLKRIQDKAFDIVETCIGSK